MGWIDRLMLFSTIDLVAVVTLVALWLIMTLLVEHSPGSRPSVSRLMADYRREWMQNFVTRDPRIFDSQIIGNLRQGTAFFASACMIAIGGGFALLGNAERLQGVAAELVQEQIPVVVWEIKLLLLILFAANAFLKFVWAHRLFGYCAVLMAAVPNDPADPKAFPRAKIAAEINVLAARSYNRGLRSVYFGIASGAWLIGPWPLLIMAAFTALVILRREFASQSRAVLMREPGKHTNVKS